MRHSTAKHNVSQHQFPSAKYRSVTLPVTILQGVTHPDTTPCQNIILQPVHLQSQSTTPSSCQCNTSQYQTVKYNSCYLHNTTHAYFCSHNTPHYHTASHNTPHYCMSEQSNPNHQHSHTHYIIIMSKTVHLGILLLHTNNDKL